MSEVKAHATPTPLPGLVVVNVDYAKDERGFFIESWSRRDFAAIGIAADFVQDSHSASRYGVLRGMHYQDMRAPTAKLVRCTIGRVLDVVIDLRTSSPTFAKWFSVELTTRPWSTYRWDSLMDLRRYPITVRSSTNKPTITTRSPKAESHGTTRKSGFSGLIPIQSCQSEISIK
jgi:hypothetical protein